MNISPESIISHDSGKKDVYCPTKIIRKTSVVENTSINSINRDSTF
jgi:hypothetical protein